MPSRRLRPVVSRPEVPAMLDEVRPPNPRTVARIVRAALEEDHADNDVTTRALGPPDQRGRGVFLMKAPGVMCGIEVVRATFAELSRELDLEVFAPDGSSVEPGQVIAE